MVGAQAPEARLQCSPHEGRLPALWPLALRVLLAALVENVSKLGRELDPVPVRAEHATHELLVRPLAIGVARLEEGNAQVERLEQEALARLLAHLAPPGRAKRPSPEADLRCLEVGVAEAARPHARSLVSLSRTSGRRIGRSHDPIGSSGAMASGGSNDPRGPGFLLTAQGWPYLLVPFIPLAIALELANASAT